MVYILYSELTQKIDTLTHLLNRRSYESRLASLRGHAVIYYFDVDEFKSVNDTFGHGVGDAVLAEVGSTVSIQDDLSRQRVAYMEDRSISDGSEVMVYGNE